MNEHYYSKNPRSSHRRQMITSTLRNEHITFVTDSGVFSKDRIDYGTKLLVESFSIPEIKGDLLDLGCGYGPIGLTLAKAYPKRHVYLTDINKRAISLTEKNAKKNNITNVHILQSDGLSKLENERFAAIITNPPIRAGKKV